MLQYVFKYKQYDPINRQICNNKLTFGFKFNSSHTHPPQIEMKDCQQSQLDLQTVQEHQTTQNYVTTLFDSLPRIDLSCENHMSPKIIKKLLQQNKVYGRKIIELSQKFTSFYRKDHIYDKKDVQQKIRQIYQIVIEEEISGEMQIDQMLTSIVKRLKADSYSMLRTGYQQLQQSQARNFQGEIMVGNRMVESKIESKIESKVDSKGQLKSNSGIRESKVVPNQNLYLSSLNPNGESIIVSRKESTNNKSKTKSTRKKEKNILEQEEIPLKKILKIKGYMQEEQGIIKQLIQKITLKLNEMKISKLNISAQKLTYTRVQDETNRQNLESLLYAATTNHKVNLINVNQLMQLVFVDFQRKMSNEMLSENRFAIYTKEIEKREEVYSYAVSKLIGHVNNLKSSLSQQRYRQSMEITQDLISIGTKFYQLYPSNSTIKELKVKSQRKQFQSLMQNNYGVQVNTIKPQKAIINNTKSSLQSSNRLSAQYQLQMFKFQTKFNQLLQKFQRNQMKFKKSLQVKQVSKLLNSIKQLVPDRNRSTLNSGQKEEMVKFQEEYKELLRQTQVKQQKMSEDYLKRQRKYQKTIKQLQQAIELCEQQRQKQLNIAKEEIRKLNKKLQTLQEKHKLSQKTNQQSQKTIKIVKQQIQTIKKKYRQEQLSYEHKYQQLQQKLLSVNQQTNIKQSQITRLSSMHSQKLSQFDSELVLYKKKIVLLEEQNQQLTRENQQLIYRLQQLTTSAQFSKEKLSEMTDIYQSKIKEVDQMIEAIKEMKNQLQSKNQKIEQLQGEKQKHHSTTQKLHQQIQKHLHTITKLNKDLQNQKKDKLKILESGQLNEEDINKLKDQMLKVHTAYVQSQEELQTLRELYQQLQAQTNKLQDQNRNLINKIEELSQVSLEVENLQKSNHNMKQAITQLESQNQQLTAKINHLQNQLYLTKKQTKKLKQEELDQSRQTREIRQQLQKLKEEESLTKGKFKIELETLKIELRKKTEENNKLKETYQDKTEILQAKYKELQKFVTQKELLARISNNHSTQ